MTMDSNQSYSYTQTSIKLDKKYSKKKPVALIPEFGEIVKPELSHILSEISQFQKFRNYFNESSWMRLG